MGQSEKVKYVSLSQATLRRGSRGLNSQGSRISQKDKKVINAENHIPSLKVLILFLLMEVLPTPSKYLLHIQFYKAY